MTKIRYANLVGSGRRVNQTNSYNNTSIRTDRLPLQTRYTALASNPRRTAHDGLNRSDPIRTIAAAAAMGATEFGGMLRQKPEIEFREPIALSDERLGRFGSVSAALVLCETFTRERIV